MNAPMRVRRGWLRRLLALLAVGHLAACAQIGPDRMRASRLAYNEALQASEQREMLLNLVLLRHADTPEFLGINGISTQMTLEAAVGFGASIGEDGGADTSLYAPSGSATYSETPTITFTPQRDQAFSRQLFAPIEIDSVYLLSRYGWGIDLVLRLVAERINGVSNALPQRVDGAPSQSDPAVFRDVASRLRRLEAAGLLRVGVEQRSEPVSAPLPADQLGPADIVGAVQAGYRVQRRADDHSYVLLRSAHYYVLEVDPAAQDSEDFRFVAARLGVPGDRPRYDIDPGGSAGVAGAAALRVDTRSVLGVMAYLSAGVAVPDANAAPAGSGAASPRDLLTIRVADQPVDDAYLAAPYRGHWYFVDNDDVESRRTLALLTSLIRLSIDAGGAQNVPLLTLPVAR